MDGATQRLMALVNDIGAAYKNPSPDCGWDTRRANIVFRITVWWAQLFITASRNCERSVHNGWQFVRDGRGTIYRISIYDAALNVWYRGNFAHCFGAL